MQIEHVRFDVIEFEDCQGEIRTIRGCPLAKREEFRARLNLLDEWLKGQMSVADLYDTDNYFRHLCDKALEVCGISPDWVSISMLVQLLFERQDDQGESYPGYLVSLNFPPRQPKPGSKPVTHEDLLAAIWSHTEDLDKALNLAESLPAEQLLGILEAKAMQSPAAQEEAKKADYKAKARQKREELLKAGGE